MIDGAILAAEAIGADEIMFYIGEEHGPAVAAMSRAVEERRDEHPRPSRLVKAPISYVAGEATAAVHYIDSGDARPTTTPPRVSERGVRGRPTLVQNVESLAYAALIARFGEGWYRSAGRFETRGHGPDHRHRRGPGPGSGRSSSGRRSGRSPRRPERRRRDRAVVLGGYFGTWARVHDAWDLPLDPRRCGPPA